MLNRLAEKYKKEKFYAKVEPDNYVSQLLVEKLGGFQQVFQEIIKYRMKDMKETLEDLMEIKGSIDKSALNKKLDEMENKLLSRIDKIDSTNYFSENLNG